MGVIGLLVSLVAGLFMLIGLIPFLGWTNWFLSLPAATLAAVISSIAVSRNRSNAGIVGLVISATVFVIALARLFVGCGII